MAYFLLFLISFLIAVLLAPIFRKIGVKYDFCDRPDGDVLKIHKTPISLLGGLAIFLDFSVLFLLFSYFGGFLNWKIGAIILAGFLIFFLGFWDDYKWKKSGVSLIKKFLFLALFSFLAAVILLGAGIKIQVFGGIWICLVLTFFYILGAVNAVNFEDGMDGLAGGLAIISLLGFIFLSLISGNFLAFIISLVLLAAVSGFLVFNLPPAKIFMGDSGAYFLGFLLAVLAMVFSLPNDLKSFIGPILVIGLPVFDAAQVILRRILSKKPIFSGSRNHFYDILHFKEGFSTKETLLICYLIQVIFVAGGLFLFYI